MKTFPVVPTFMLAGAVSALALLSTGCTSTRGRTIYTQSQANQTLRVDFGTVVGVRSVVIEGTNSPIGTYGGAAIGAAAGRGVGSGVGRSVAGAAGGVGGAIIGREIEKAITRKEGLEIHIKLDNGTHLVVVQEADQAGFEDGDRVRVMTGAGTAVVSH